MKNYELPLSPDEVKSLVSALAFAEPIKNGDNAAAFSALSRKATALLTYVRAEEQAEEAGELYKEALEMANAW